jgi:hypothetical protein
MSSWLTDGNLAVRERHLGAFRRESGYIPLGISLRSRISINDFRYFQDYRAMFDNEMHKAEAIRTIGSDMVPTLNLRYEHVVMQSMFGAEVKEIGGFPWVEPWLSLEDVPELRQPPVDSGIVPLVSEAIEYFQKHAAPGMVVCKPPETAPIEAAISAFGSGLFMALYTDTELAVRALKLFTENFITVNRHFKKLLGEPRGETVTYTGTVIPGIRLAADTLVNLSPEMIRSFINPNWQRIAEEFGGVLVHYCPSPDEKYYHVLAPTLACPGVIGIDQSAGVEYLESKDNPQRMAEHTTFPVEVAFRKAGAAEVEDRATNINRLIAVDWDDMESWWRSDFVQLSVRKKRGLILRARVDSVEEGRELYGRWREIQGEVG